MAQRCILIPLVVLLVFLSFVIVLGHPLQIQAEETTKIPSHTPAIISGSEQVTKALYLPVLFKWVAKIIL
jgi:hypothetical protein